MKGQVYKIHSDFYYVEPDRARLSSLALGVEDCPAIIERRRVGTSLDFSPQEFTIEAKVRDVLKKQAANIVVGDFVELEALNYDARQAFISKIYERSNFIPRPKAANVDQVIIVTAIKEPELDFEQLNRYLCLCSYYKIPPVLCFNKNDLLDDKETIKKIESIYNPLGYETVFISALEKNGLKEIEAKLDRKVSVLCGMSGVGKSTILNVIQPDLQLKTQAVSAKTSKGTHTTRHCEIINVALSNGGVCKVVDTPGFSNLKFDFLMPAEISELFGEIKQLKTKCKFKDCLHINEQDCNVLSNLAQISQSRYSSYLKFVDEAAGYKKLISEQGTKKESRSKIINKREVAKINAKKREMGRRAAKQSLNQMEKGQHS